MNDMSMPNAAAAQPSAPSEGKKDSDMLVSIEICVYPGGKLALRLDGGKKMPVPDVETALAAVRRVVESESAGPMETAETPGQEATEPQDEAAAEKDFVGGFRGPSGY